MSNSLQPHEQHHARLPCPSPSSWACSNSCSEWLLPSKHLILCHPLLFMPSIFPNMMVFSNDLSFLDSSVDKESSCNAEDPIWSRLRKTLCSRDRLPTPVFLAREFHGQRSLVGGCKELDMTEQLILSLFNYIIEWMNEWIGKNNP